MDPKVEARVSGVVFTSPAVGIQPSHPFAVVRISIKPDSYRVHKPEHHGWYPVDVKKEIKSLTGTLLFYDHGSY